MYVNRHKILFGLLACLLFAASVWYIVEHFQWREVFAYLLRVDYVKLIGLVWLIHFAYICVRAWRWQVVVRYANSEVRFIDLYWITAVMVSLSIITPGHLGETLKIELLKRRGLLGRLPGLGGFAIERILDLLVIAGMGVVGLVFGSGISERNPGLELGVAFLLMLGLIALYLVRRFNPGGQASRWLSRMRSGSGSPLIWIKMGILTILSWCLVGAGWQVSLYAVGIHLALPETLWLIALVTIGTLLSFIPGGLGVAEVLTVHAIENMGVASILAQTGALALRGYGIIVLLFGTAHLVPWIIYWLVLKVRYHDSTH